MTLPCNNLNLNLYRVFYTVAKTKSFSESSRTLHISQPAISKHIQNLEYELNTLLFYRTNRGIELTSEAKKLLVYVEKAYNYLMLGERELEEGKELTKGKISIGIPPFISSNYLNDYIKEYIKNHPNIIIEITNHEEDKLFELFEQHNIDILIIPSEIKTNKELKTIELKDEEYCFAINSENLNKEQITTLEELIARPLILPSQNTKQRKSLENYLSIKGISLNPIIELESNEMIASYTKENMGIGYIPKSICLKDNNLTILNISEKLPTEKITLIYNDNTMTTSSREFIDIINK